jgi:hypothetical protein
VSLDFVRKLAIEKSLLVYDHRLNTQVISHLLYGLGMMSDPKGKMMGRAFSHPVFQECTDIGFKVSPGIGVAGQGN